MHDTSRPAHSYGLRHFLIPSVGGGGAAEDRGLYGDGCEPRTPLLGAGGGVTLSRRPGQTCVKHAALGLTLGVKGSWVRIPPSDSVRVSAAHRLAAVVIASLWRFSASSRS